MKKQMVALLFACVLSVVSADKATVVAGQKLINDALSFKELQYEATAAYIAEFPPATVLPRYIELYAALRTMRDNKVYPTGSETAADVES